MRAEVSGFPAAELPVVGGLETAAPCWQETERDSWILPADILVPELRIFCDEVGHHLHALR